MNIDVKIASPDENIRRESRSEHPDFLRDVAEVVEVKTYSKN
jgi:hypothetical protein